MQTSAYSGGYVFSFWLSLYLSLSVFLTELRKLTYDGVILIALFRIRRFLLTFFFASVQTTAVGFVIDFVRDVLWMS